MVIPNDKIVVVTGDPRSGTSLMMQTLLALGVPVAGDKFPSGRRLQRRIEHMEDGPERDRLREEIERREEEIRDKNPKGFYEVPGVVMRGLKEVGVQGGKAIKIISPGAYPKQTPRGIQGTPPELVHKYILCLRDPRPVAVSQSELAGSVRVAGVKGWDSPTWRTSPTRYMIENGGLARWLIEQGNPAAWLVVDYDQFLADPSSVVADIANHLNLSPGPQQIDDAVANVDTSLRRSPNKFTQWPDGLKIEGAIVEDLYTEMKTLNVLGMTAVLTKVEQQVILARLEQTRWYDDSVGLIVNPSLARKLLTDAAFHSRLIAMYHKELRRGMHPQVAAAYEDDGTGEEYTIERPVDLGPLVRRMIRYNGDPMTREAALAHHQRLWSRGAVAIDFAKLALLLEESS